MNQDQLDTLAVIQDQVRHLIEDGVSLSEILQHAIYLPQSQVGIDLDMHYFLSCMLEIVKDSNRHREQIEMALTLNYKPKITVRKLAERLHAVASRQIMVPFRDEDAFLTLLKYQLGMRNWPVIDSICTQTTTLLIKGAS